MALSIELCDLINGHGLGLDLGHSFSIGLVCGHGHGLGIILVMVLQNIGTWALSRETYFSFTQSSSIASKILETLSGGIAT